MASIRLFRLETPSIRPKIRCQVFSLGRLPPYLSLVSFLAFDGQWFELALFAMGAPIGDGLSYFGNTQRKAGGQQDCIQHGRSLTQESQVQYGEDTGGVGASVQQFPAP
ncbi:MAG: hypothetical protein KDJ65_40795, partial [Anaerolineae bacterium]|nr:hypothetical protein [Anaerolineae bacterium]